MAERSTDLGTYQMLWDCPYCGTPKLLALDHKHCPACGGAQDPTRRYFPKDDEKVAVEGHVFVGKDKICGACEAPNAASATFCGACGAPLDGSKEAATRADQREDAAGNFQTDSARTAAQEHRDAQKAATEAKLAATNAAHGAPPEKPSTGGGIPWKGVGCGVFALLLLICAGIFFLWKKDAALTSTNHAWEKTISVEEKREVTEKAWKDEVPAGASSVSCQREQRSTKQVADGETCSTRRKDNGDGTFKEVEDCKTKYKSEPVYDQRCTYQIEKWVSARTAKSNGSRKDAPKWPDPKLRRTGNCLGCEREGTKTETWTLYFKDEASKKELSCSVNKGVWDKVEPGTKWVGQIGVVSGTLDCDKLKPAK
jgi:hypothetical protein